MNSNPFRKKNLDNISTPQEMNDYLRVSSPGVWAVLIGVAVLLIGVLAWSIGGRLETLQPVVIEADSGANYCYIRADKIDRIKIGSKVRVGTKEYTVQRIPEEPILADTLHSIILSYGTLPSNTWVYKLSLDGEAVESVVEGNAVLESFAPISLLLNIGGGSDE